MGLIFNIKSNYQHIQALLNFAKSQESIKILYFMECLIIQINHLNFQDNADKIIDA